MVQTIYTYKPANEEVLKIQGSFKPSKLAGSYNDNAYTCRSMKHDIYDITNYGESYLLDFSPPF